jgi:hypothetical protein
VTLESGRLFYIAGPETGEVCSTNLVRVRDIKQSVLLAERNDWPLWPVGAERASKLHLLNQMGSESVIYPLLY